MTDPEIHVEPTTTPESHLPSYGTVVTGIILVVLGVLWLLDVADVLSISLGMVFPLALAVVGLALMVGSFRGHHPGLVTLGVFLTILTLMVSFLPGTFRGGIGDREVRVTEMSQLEDSYGMALGKITLDLTDLEMTESAEVQLSVGAGEIIVADETAQGITPRLEYTGPGYEDASTTLTLNIDVGAGKIEVR